MIVHIHLDSLVQGNKADFSSVYASNETKILDSLTKMIESYKSIE